MAACCTHPLDLAKVLVLATVVSNRSDPVLYSRMQTLKSAEVRPSTFSVIRSSVSQNGFRSLYTGLSASLLRQMTYSLVRLGAYEEMKYRMSQTGPLSTGKLLLAASLAGGLGGIAGNPAGQNPRWVCLVGYP